MTAVTVVGDAVLDREWTGEVARLCADSTGPVVDLHDEQSRPGGAALAAVAAVAQGCTVTLVSALGAGAAGDELRRLLRDHDVELVDLGLECGTPEKIRVRVSSTTVCRVDRGDVIGRPGGWTDRAQRAVMRADAVVLSDYGRGLLGQVPRTGEPIGRPVVWDPHPTAIYPPLRPTLCTPNMVEAAQLSGLDGPPSLLAPALARRWQTAVAVTCGGRGAEFAAPGVSRSVPTIPMHGDPCGAGDWFAAGAAAALARGADPLEATVAGCASAGRWVGGRHLLSEQSRAERVVATSGAFDVLHIGHIELLRHARGLGDRLVVFLNSDASVAALKGPQRPLNPQWDRAAVLLALDTVDEVVVFDQPTPCAALERLRPDVFVKGADYRDVRIPEIATVAQWGGRVEFAPLVPGRSTTRVVQIARQRAS